MVVTISALWNCHGRSLITLLERPTRSDRKHTGAGREAQLSTPPSYLYQVTINGSGALWPLVRILSVQLPTEYHQVILVNITQTRRRITHANPICIPRSRNYEIQWTSSCSLSLHFEVVYYRVIPSQKM